MATKGPVVRKESPTENRFTTDEIALFKPLYLKCKNHEMTAKDACLVLNKQLVEKGYSQADRELTVKKFIAYGKTADHVLRAEQKAKEELTQATREAEEATREAEQAKTKYANSLLSVATRLEKLKVADQELEASNKRLQELNHQKSLLTQSIAKSEQKIAAAKSEARQAISNQLSGVAVRPYSSKPLGVK